MKKLLTALLLQATMLPFFASAQIHPVAYGTDGGTVYRDNWYKEYVGLLFDVITPASIAGSKAYTYAGSGASAWGGTLTAPLLNKQIVMPQPGDSLCSVPITVPMAGKVALVYRGAGIEFSVKALAAQTAGAIACIIVNDVPGGPVGMAPGTSGSAASVTIPVFMVSKADGDAMDIQYLLGASVTVSIGTWGRNHNRDLGFVPQGNAGWANYATPANQLFPSTGAWPYKGLSGAFIANYGLHNATNVKVRDTLRYTPSAGAPTVLHTGVTPNLALFTPADSIYAMFNTAAYNVAPTAAGTGRFDLKYNIVSDSVDQYAADNSATYSFYASDSVYSKGTYDFTNNVPYASEGFSFGTSGYLWGATYYVARGGTAISSVQFSLKETTLMPISLSVIEVNAFKWTDGAMGDPPDSLVAGL